MRQGERGKAGTPLRPGNACLTLTALNAGTGSARSPLPRLPLYRTPGRPFPAPRGQPEPRRAKRRAAAGEGGAGSERQAEATIPAGPPPKGSSLRARPPAPHHPASPSNACAPRPAARVRPGPASPEAEPARAGQSRAAAAARAARRQGTARRGSRGGGGLPARLRGRREGGEMEPGAPRGVKWLIAPAAARFRAPSTAVGRGPRPGPAHAG